MFLSFSEQLKKMVSDILTDYISGVFDVTMIINNPDTGYRYEPFAVVDMSIKQDFVSAYTDEINATIQIRPRELLELLQNLQNLEATVILRRVDTYMQKILQEEEPIIFNCRVVTDTSEDPEKKYQLSTLIGNEEETENEKIEHQNQLQFMQFPLQLIEVDVYDLRHKRIHGKFDDVTIEDIMHYIAQQFEIPFVKMVPPDNTMTYSNFIIEPVRGIDDIFRDLQERSGNGIYAKGAGYYYTKQTLYAYPLYDTEPVLPLESGVAHIVSAPSDLFKGEEGYQNRLGEDIYLLSVTQVNSKDLSTIGSENIGTAQVAMNADTVVDQYSTVSKDGTMTKSDSTLSIVSLADTQSQATDRMQNIAYRGPTSNPYQMTAELSATNATFVTIVCFRIDPRILSPGHVCRFHYDGKNNEYKIQNGIVQAVHYKSVPYDSRERKPWLGFNAAIGLRLVPDKRAEE